MVMLCWFIIPNKYRYSLPINPRYWTYWHHLSQLWGTTSYSDWMVMFDGILWGISDIHAILVMLWPLNLCFVAFLLHVMGLDSQWHFMLSHNVVFLLGCYGIWWKSRLSDGPLTGVYWTGNRTWFTDGPLGPLATTLRSVCSNRTGGQLEMCTVRVIYEQDVSLYV